MENIKIWCETKEERDAVLKEMDKRGFEWITGHKPTKYKCVYDAPMGLFYEHDYILQIGNDRNLFVKDDNKEITVQEFLGKPKRTKQIHITTDGTNTYAVLKENGKVVKRSVAKCSPEDKFDFDVGAMLAINRLISDFKSNGYVCAQTNEDGYNLSIRNTTVETLLNIALSLLEEADLKIEFVKGLQQLIKSQYE